MKKLLIYVIVAVVCVVSMTSSVSANFAKSNKFNFAVEPIVLSGYNEIFGDGCESPSSYDSNTSKDTASVAYDLSVDIDSPYKGYVTANISLQINGKLCYSSVSGEVQAMPITNDKYWEGCLRGNMKVDSSTYDDIYVFFNKLDSSEDIRMSLSISTEYGQTSFMFGSLLLDEQTYSEIDAQRNYYNSQKYYS